MIRAVNDKVVESLGFSREALLKMKFGEVVDSGFNVDLKNIIKKVVKEGSIIHETEFKKKDNSAYPVELSLKYIKDKDSQYIIVVARNIAYRKFTENKLKASYQELKDIEKIKNNIISNVGHELRTPLTIAWNAVELMEQSESEEDYKEIRKMIFDAFERLNLTIDNLIGVSKIYSSKTEHKEIINLTMVITEVVETFDTPDKNGKIKINIPKKISYVEISESGLKKVLGNIIHNSFKFTDKPVPEIHIKVTEEENFIKVCIIDNGIGVPESDLIKIFEPFYQVDASSSRAYEGVGMGLSVAFGIISEYGGQVWAERNNDPGTTICFRVKRSKEKK